MKTVFKQLLKRKKSILFFVVFGVLSLVFLALVKVTITGNHEGLYLLKGRADSLFELKDDLFLNEERRYLFGIDCVHGKQAVADFLMPRTIGEPYLYFEWNDQKGDGFVRNHLPGGKQLLTCFSRFLDDNNKEDSGLFVGGGLPKQVLDPDNMSKNETGMAYYDGTRWFHIWCNSNEAIFSPNQFEPIAPSSWTFLGSSVRHHSDRDLLLESSHQVFIDGMPLRIDRYAYFRAGETYFILKIIISNNGTRPVIYSYQYGDEPWLGNYGSSIGNVGWAADGLHKFSGRIDSKKLRYAGFFDYGNDAIGEDHTHTQVSNFIEWFGDEEPVVYFTNGPNDPPQINAGKMPLFSNTRFIGLLWGAQSVQPGKSKEYTIAIGMAGQDPKTGFPVMPKIDTHVFP